MSRFWTFAAAFVCALFCRSLAAEQPPNIVFIMVDDLGPTDLGCYGSKTIATPNLDRMAEEGMRFTNAYAPSAVCAPTRASLLTSKHQGQASLRSNTGGVSLRDDDITFAEVIRPAGYAIGGFGKWGVGDVRTPGVPEKQGFDVFFGYYHQIHAHDYFTEYLWRNGSRVDLPENKGFGVQSVGAVETTEPKRVFAHYRIKQEMFDWIRTNKDRPFLCYAPWTPPHGRFTIPAEDPAWSLYKDKPWPMQDRVHAAFATMIDRNVGEVLTLLTELNLDDNTIVFFCSDNGASSRFEKSHKSSGPYRGEKTKLYEGGLRAPLIARWPGMIKAGSVSDHVLCWIDMMPTFAELVGARLNLPDDINGISIAPTLLGKHGQQEHEYLYFEWVGYNWNNVPLDPKKLAQAIRVGTWKLVRHGAHKPWELYNLDDDVGESNDLADKMPEKVKQLVDKIAEVRTEPGPQREPKMPIGKKYR